MVRIEPESQRGPVSSAIQNAGEILHWLGRRLIAAEGGSEATPVHVQPFARAAVG